MTTSPKVSIIIPAYNCQKLIIRSIPASLSAASAYRNDAQIFGASGFAQVIVVDDGSTDQTKAEITKFPTVKYFYQPNAGPAAARNLGALEADGDILFFTDSDCLPHVDWIEKMLVHFKNSKIGVVAGSYGIANPENRLSRCIHAEIRFRHEQLVPDFPEVFGSFNFAIRKSVFQEVGGFDTRYRNASGEDNDLSYKIRSHGYQIYFAKDVVVDHFHTERVGKYLQEQFRHGFWRVKMYCDHPQMVMGDGYTFWKDIVEVPLVCLVYVGWGLMMINFFGLGLGMFLGSLLILFLINFYFALKIIKNIGDGFFYCDVMVLRAFSRTHGFISGALAYLFQQDQHQKNRK